MQGQNKNIYGAAVNREIQWWRHYTASKVWPSALALTWAKFSPTTLFVFKVCGLLMRHCSYYKKVITYKVMNCAICFYYCKRIHVRDIFILDLCLKQHFRKPWKFMWKVKYYMLIVRDFTLISTIYMYIYISPNRCSWMSNHYLPIQSRRMTDNSSHKNDR